jgi:hypothetical protein
MGKWEPCKGTGENAVDVKFYPALDDGWNCKPASTYGRCPTCGYVQGGRGDLRGHGGTFTIRRHKDKRTAGANVA